jgi:hypothetical protein
MGSSVAPPDDVASRTSVQRTQYAFVRHKNIAETVMLHLLPPIILDDGHDRQGHFATATLADQEKPPGTR